MTTVKESNKTVLVIGSAGFLGRYAAKHFIERGWNVIGIDSVAPQNAPLSIVKSYYSVKLPFTAFGDILCKHSPDVCIHCAGSASVPLSVTDPVSDFYANPVLTFEVLNALRLHAPKCRFILLSSAAVYGNPRSLPVNETDTPVPISPYGFHKWQCEQLCLEFAWVYGLCTASLRIFSAYGPGLRRQVIWDICLKAITQQKLLLQGTGRESRDFVHARDIAVAMETVATSAPMCGEVYNLGTGREVTISELAQIILKELGIDGAPNFDGVIPRGNPLNWQADISLLARFGFSPSVSLEQGIQSVVKWCREEISGA
jgi:UDP-glucose 4-epimerase